MDEQEVTPVGEPEAAPATDSIFTPAFTSVPIGFSETPAPKTLDACRASRDGEAASPDDTCVFCHLTIAVRCVSQPSWCAAICYHEGCKLLLQVAE